MEFSKAMKMLEEGNKVTREPWMGSIYFKKQGIDIKSYQPKIEPYLYNEDIMVSEGWVVEGKEGEFKFCDIIDYLLQGLKARLSHWEEKCIYLDLPNKVLILHSMDILPFIPDFSSFVVDDWMLVL